MTGTTHLRWLGGRSRCGRGSNRTYNHERVTCRTCLRLGPQQLEMFPRAPEGARTPCSSTAGVEGVGG
jgi:hypothetical protein